MTDWLPVPSGGPVPHDFSIMRTPVTNAQYCAYLNSLPRPEARARYCPMMAQHFWGGVLHEGGTYRHKPAFAEKPVVFVSWHDAQAFAAWAGGRLPTADEWRKAAAWRCSESRFAKYCTGFDEPPSQDSAQKNSANFYDDANGWALPQPHLADVARYASPGPYGTLGMGGNVAEWVDGAMPNGWKFALGGSLFRPVEQILLSAAEGDHPAKRLSTFGFRLARDSR